MKDNLFFFGQFVILISIIGTNILEHIKVLSLELRSSVNIFLRIPRHLFSVNPNFKRLYFQNTMSNNTNLNNEIIEDKKIHSVV